MNLGPIFLASAALGAILFGNANATDDAGVAQVVARFRLPEIPLNVMQRGIGDDRGYSLGGVGSDLFHARSQPLDRVWMLTDRGPNLEHEVGDATERIFPLPTYTPMILEVLFANGSLRVERAIEIVDRAGEPLTGLPNRPIHDEAPYDTNGARIPDGYRASGIDPEGMVRTEDGGFWIAEEYGPSLLRVDAAGRVEARYVPIGLGLGDAGYPIVENLPPVYARRTRNRGFEGLAIDAAERVIYAIVQTPLANPDAETADACTATRILAFDVAERAPIGEWMYPLESHSAFDPLAKKQDEMRVSAIACAGPGRLRVVESSKHVVRIYQVELTDEADVFDHESNRRGALDSKLESKFSIDRSSIPVLDKTLVADLAGVAGMPLKIEGLAYLPDGSFLLANDNDFDLGELGPDGRNHGKGKPSEILRLTTRQRDTAK